MSTSHQKILYHILLSMFHGLQIRFVECSITICLNGPFFKHEILSSSLLWYGKFCVTSRIHQSSGLGMKVTESVEKNGAAKYGKISPLSNSDWCIHMLSQWHFYSLYSVLCKIWWTYHTGITCKVSEYRL